MSTVIENLDKAQRWNVWEKPPSRKRVVGVVRDEDMSLRAARLFEASLHRRIEGERRSMYPPAWSGLDPALMRQLLTYPRFARQALFREVLLERGIRVQQAAKRNEHAIRVVERYRLQTHRPSLLRIGGLTGLAVMFASIPLLLASISIGLIGMYAGFGLFALANYAAYRAGERNYIIGPSVSAALAGASFLLAFVALAGAF